MLVKHSCLYSVYSNADSTTEHYYTPGLTVLPLLLNLKDNKMQGEAGCVCGG